MIRSLWTSRSILLLDGVGAVVTAVAVGLVLPALQPFFGVPTPMLRLLGGLAVAFAIYSLGHHFTGRNTPVALRTIALANLGYCVLTLFILAAHRSQVTPLTWIYFGGEIAIVTALARRELSLARRG